MNSVEGVFGKLSNPYKKLALGGVMLSVLIFLFPPLYGEGYDTIELLLNGVSNADWDTVLNNSLFYGYGNLLLVYLVLIILLKVFASSATNGGGGCGGILHLRCIWDVLPVLCFRTLAMILTLPRLCPKRTLR